MPRGAAADLLRAVAQAERFEVLFIHGLEDLEWKMIQENIYICLRCRSLLLNIDPDHQQILADYNRKFGGLVCVPMLGPGSCCLGPL